MPAPPESALNARRRITSGVAASTISTLVAPEFEGNGAADKPSSPARAPIPPESVKAAPYFLPSAPMPVKTMRNVGEPESARTRSGMTFASAPITTAEM